MADSDSVLPIQLLAVLSTYVQSFEPSIQGLTKLGLTKLVETGFALLTKLVETGFALGLEETGFLRYRLADALFH